MKTEDNLSPSMKANEINNHLFEMLQFKLKASYSCSNV